MGNAVAERHASDVPWGHTPLEDILIALYYIAAIAVIVLHYTGWLADRGLEWIVYVVLVLMFPMLYFAYTP